jgi:hypothetical protein
LLLTRLDKNNFPDFVLMSGVTSMSSSIDYSGSEKAEVMPLIAVSKKLAGFAFLKNVGLAWTL